MSRTLGVAVVLASLAASTAWADRPIRAINPIWIDPAKVPAVVDSHTVFLNRCTGGCTLHAGASDSRSDTSDILEQTGRTQATLTAYPYGHGSWDLVKQCVAKIMVPFNITVTD